MISIALPDIFSPDLRVTPDEFRHQSFAIGIVHNNDLNAVLAQKSLVTPEGLIFPDHHSGNAKLNYSSSAHHTRTERSVQCRVRIGCLAASVSDAVHFAVCNRITSLDSLVVAGCDHLVIADQHGAHGHATVIKAIPPLFPRCV
jgi:hypothetical protein